MEELNTWLLDNTTQEQLVLLGMGGAGKTQLSLECCRRAEASKQFTSLIWIEASSIDSIQESLKVVVSKIGGSHLVSLDVNDNLDTIVQALQQRGGRWLAVFDNARLSALSQQNLITSYIPEAENGKILFTGREAGLERLGHVIRVSGMTESESLDLLLKRPAEEKEKTFALQVAAELGHLALAIDQAGAYIEARNLLLKDFSEHFRLRKMAILQHIPEHWEYRLGVTDAERDIVLSTFTTWELSLQQTSGSPEVKQKKERFLTLCAMFDTASISREYFEFYCRSTDTQCISIFESEGTWDGFKFDDVAAECRTLSLLQSEGAYHREGLLALHPLVRDWLKLRKSPEDKQEVAEEYTNILVSYIAAADLNLLEQAALQRVLANIDSCIQEDERFQNPQMHSSSYPSYAVRLFAEAYNGYGFYEKAGGLLKQALVDMQNKLGNKHLDTLKTMQLLAITYLSDELWDESVELYEQALHGYTEILGINHFDTVQAVNGLAIAYASKGKYDEAEELLKQIFDAQPEKFGPAHLDALQNLAIIYQYKGNLDEAERLIKQVLSISPKRLEPEHAKTQVATRCLALIYLDKGRYHEAEKLLKQVLESKREQLVPDLHHQMFPEMMNVAAVYMSTARYTKAEELYKQVLAGLEGAIILHRPRLMFVTLSGLASCYYEQGKNDKATDLMNQILTGLKRRIMTRPSYMVVPTIYSLAEFCFSQGRYDEAMEFYKQVLAAKEEIRMPKNYFAKMETIYHLATIYMRKGMKKELMELCEQVSRGEALTRLVLQLIFLPVRIITRYIPNTMWKVLLCAMSLQLALSLTRSCIKATLGEPDPGYIVVTASQESVPQSCHSL